MKLEEKKDNTYRNWSETAMNMVVNEVKKNNPFFKHCKKCDDDMEIVE